LTTLFTVLPPYPIFLPPRNNFLPRFSCSLNRLMKIIFPLLFRNHFVVLMFFFMLRTLFLCDERSLVIMTRHFSSEHCLLVSYNSAVLCIFSRPSAAFFYKSQGSFSFSPFSFFLAFGKVKFPLLRQHSHNLFFVRHQSSSFLLFPFKRRRK